MPEDTKETQPSETAPKPQPPAKLVRGTRKLRRLFSSRRALKKIGLALVLIGLLIGAFFMGACHGAKRQRAYDKAHPATAPLRTVEKMVPKHVVVSGTLTKDADKSSVEVKAKDGKVSTITIDDKTIITDAKGQRIDVGHLKKDAKVTVTTSTDKDNKTKADRVRLLP